MSTKHPETIDRQSSQDELTEQFVRWMLSVLRWDLRDEGDGVCSVEIPDELQAEFGASGRWRFACSPAVHAALEGEHVRDVELMVPGSPSFQQLLEQLRRRHRIVHAAPQRQPRSVHELSPRLLGAYQFDGGQIHLGGCTLEDRPVVRRTYAVSSSGDWTGLAHVYTWPDGRSVDRQTQDQLGVHSLTWYVGRKPRVGTEQIERWLGAARQHDSRRKAPTADRLLVQCVIWCKYAEGKIVFAAGDRSVEVPFGDWAKMLADGHIEPPPFRCPHSGRQSHHLATTDDGRITAAEAIAVCQCSGRRVIESDLQTCGISGQRVLPEYLETCSLTGQRVARTAMAQCGLCHQRVSPATLKGDTCRACRSLQSIAKEDPRLARVVGEFPGLHRWGHWRISETPSVYILTGRTLWRQILLVVEKQRLEPLRIAIAGRIASHWKEIPREQLNS